jgi:acetylornithine/N-succinyldiaminopimelate aminotransferase
VQGEGGVNTLDGDYVRAVEAIARREDIVLMIDEVQTGNGRSGSLYAYMHFGIKPDVVTTAKGLGAGLPIGAAMLSEKVEGVLGFGDHGSTFGGNPVCCAGALSVLERLDEAFLQDVHAKSDYIFDQLQGAKGVKSVTGLGLMIGIDCEKPAAEVVKACMERGVLCLTAKTKVRLLPALNIPMELLERAINVIKDACARKEP